MRRYSLQAVALSLAGLAVLLVIAAVLTGLALALAVAVGLAIVNLVYIPRVASRLGVSAALVALALMPLMLLLGLAMGGLEGAAWGVGLWALAIGLPRAVGRNLMRRVRRMRSAGYWEASFSTGEITRPTRRLEARPSPSAADRAPGEFGP